MSINYNTQMQDAQQRLQEAQRAAQQRQWEQDAPKREIAAAEAELHGIQHRARQDELSRRRAILDAEVRRTLELNTTLVAVLASGDVVKAMSYIEEADAAWKAHRSALFAVLEMVVDGYFTDRDMGALAERFHLPQAWGWGYSVKEWVGASQDVVTTRIRMGFQYALGLMDQHGRPLDAELGFSAERSYMQQQRGAMSPFGVF